VKVVIGELQNSEFLAMKELPRKVSDVVRLQVERFKGSLQVEDLGRNIGQGKVREILMQNEGEP
jgi:hypothetical protein